jgi:hypothetical protein
MGSGVQRSARSAGDDNSGRHEYGDPEGSTPDYERNTVAVFRENILHRDRY